MMRSSWLVGGLIVAAVTLLPACTGSKPAPAPSTSTRVPTPSTGLIVGTGEPCIGPRGPLLAHQYEQTRIPVTEQDEVTLIDLSEPTRPERNVSVTTRYRFATHGGRVTRMSATFHFTLDARPGTYRLTELGGKTTVHVRSGQTVHAALFSTCG